MNNISLYISEKLHLNKESKLKVDWETVKEEILEIFKTNNIDFRDWYFTTFKEVKDSTLIIHFTKINPIKYGKVFNELYSKFKDKDDGFEYKIKADTNDFIITIEITR